MSLSRDGVWKSGVWAQTVWADGVWYESAAAPRGGGGGSYFKFRGRKRPRYWWEEEENLEKVMQTPPSEAEMQEIPVAAVQEEQAVLTEYLATYRATLAGQRALVVLENYQQTLATRLRRRRKALILLLH